MMNLTNLSAALLNVGTDAGIFSSLWDGVKKVFGNLSYVLLEGLGAASVIAAIVGLYFILGTKEKRSLGLAIFIPAIIVGTLTFTGTLKLFLNNLK